MEKRIELERRGRQPETIKEICLDNCRSPTILGLNDSFCNLEVLSMINIGLTSLKGFPKLPKLKRLELSDNRISNGLQYLENSTELEYLNLCGNRFKDLDSLEPLKAFKKLEILDLFNCEVTELDGYRTRVFELIPNLKYLDGYDKNNKEIEDEDEENDDDDDEEDDDEEENENGQDNGIMDGVNGDEEEDEDEGDDEEDFDEDSGDEDEPGVNLSYLAGDVDEEGEEEEDFQPGDDEDEDDDIDEDEEEGEDAQHSSKGEKRKLEGEDEEEA